MTSSPDFDQLGPQHGESSTTDRPSVEEIAERLAAESDPGARTEPGTPLPDAPFAEAPTGPVTPPTVTALAALDPGPDAPVSPPPGQPWPIAPKAKWAAMCATVALAAVEAGVQAARSYGLIASETAEWVLVAVAACIAGLAALLGAYRAPHQPRPGDGPGATDAG